MNRRRVGRTEMVHRLADAYYFRYDFRKLDLAMTEQALSPLARHRAQLVRRGFVRVEVNVSRDDAGLVRDVAAALSDPERQAATRTLIRQRFGAPAPVGLKALLASAPLDDIDLERDRDVGRDVDL